MKSFIINRITELSTYAGLLLILQKVIPDSWLFGIGVLLIFVGDKTLQALIGKFAPGLKNYVDGIGQ